MTFLKTLIPGAIYKDMVQNKAPRLSAALSEALCYATPVCCAIDVGIRGADALGCAAAGLTGLVGYVGCRGLYSLINKLTD